MGVQIHELPHHWCSKEVGWKLGKLLIQCLNVIYPENGEKEGRLLKVLVEMELDKPLLRGTKLKLDDEVSWVEFKYEMLPTFCYYCGIIGHSEKVCDQKLDDSRKDMVSEGEYGEWLRASQVKRGKRGESGIGTPRNEFGQHLIKHRMITNGEEMIGIEVRKTRVVQEEEANNRLEKVREKN